MVNHQHSITIIWSKNKLNTSEYDKVVLYNSSGVLVSNMLTTTSFSYTAPANAIRTFKLNCTVDTNKPQIINHSPGTGETGDSYIFNASVFDDMSLKSALTVKVNWVHGSLSGNDTMDSVGGNYFVKTITLDNYSTSALTYHFYAKDNAKVPNVNYTSQLSATISDDEYPIPRSDDTTPAPTTGDPMFFKLKVTDNIDIVSVDANYRWKQSGSWGSWITDITMTEGAGDQWSTASINAPSSATDVEYYFQVSDGTNTVYVYSGLAVTPTEGTAQGSALAKAVADNDYPVPSSDGTTAPTTGDLVTFKLTGTDNIGVSTMTANYRWMTSGIWRSWTLDAAMTKGAGDEWSTSGVINAPSNATGVQYYFQVFDGTNTVYVYSGLSVTPVEGTAQGSALAKAVADNDYPVPSSDGTTAPTTGDLVTFKLTGTDNIGVSTMTANYRWMTSGIWRSWTLDAAMTKGAGDEWSTSGVINAPSNATGVQYYFQVFDGTNTVYVYSGLSVTPVEGTAQGSALAKAVADNDYPVPSSDGTTAPTTGDLVTFKLTGTDNIGVSTMTANYRWMTSGIWRSWTLDAAMTKGAGDEWSTSGVINAPSNATGVQYYFQVFDGTNTVYVYSGLSVTPVEGTAQGSALAKAVADNDYPTPISDDTAVITTGEPMTFKLTVTDNIDVSTVTGNYRWKQAGSWGSWTLDASMTEGGSNQWSTSGAINAPSDSTDVQYYFQVYDGTNTVFIYSGGSLDVTETETVAQASPLLQTVTDNDYPVPSSDGTTAPTTGDAVTFKLTVTDNIGVSSVTASYQWKTGGIWRSWSLNAAMTKVGNEWSTSGVINAPSNATDVNYYFKVFDGTNTVFVYSGLAVTVTEVTAQGSALTKAVADNDYPVPSSDGTTAPTTGDAVTFKLTVTDNIGVSSVTASYQWKTGGIWRSWSFNAAMTKVGNEWSTSGVINAPSNATDVNYYFKVFDGTNTVFVYSGLAVTVTEVTAQGSALTKAVADNDYPVPSSDGTTAPTTGDAVTFKLTVTDNIGVSSVTASYQWKTGGIWRSWSFNAAMTKVGNEWSTSGVINAPSNATDVNYYFKVFDGTNTVFVYSGLAVTVTEVTAQGSALTKAVADNDYPVPSSDGTTAPTTGDAVTFKLTVTDNIGVSSVTASYQWKTGGIWRSWSFNAAMTKVGNEWSTSGVINAPSNATDVNYYFKVFDGTNTVFVYSGLAVTVTEVTAQGSALTKAVADNDAPTITDIGATPQKQLITGYIKLKATVTDNINLNKVNVTITGPAGFTTDNHSMTIESGNNYIYNRTYSIVGIYNYQSGRKTQVTMVSYPASYQFEIFAELQITALKTGWNFFSLPFNLTTPKTNLFVMSGSNRYTWGQAVTSGIVMNSIYNWTRAKQEYNITNTLIPGEGFWMYAYSDCQLWATNLTPIITNDFITRVKTKLEHNWSTHRFIGK